MECKANRDYEPFWNLFFEDWAAKFPERSVLFPDIPLDVVLTVEQKHKENEAWTLWQQRLMEKLHNHFSGSKAGRRANSTHNTTINNMINQIMKGSKGKSSRALKDWEMYARLHYSDKVRDVVKVEEDILKDDPDAKPAKKTNLSIIRDQTKRAFAEESEDIKKQVREAVEVMKRKKRAEIEEIKQTNTSLDNTAYISKIGAIPTQFFEELHQMTGWTFSVLMGGPDPVAGGILDISSFHVRTTTIENSEHSMTEAAALSMSNGSLPEDTPCLAPNPTISPSPLPEDETSSQLAPNSTVSLPLDNFVPSTIPNGHISTNPPHDFSNMLNTNDFFSTIHLEKISDHTLPDLPPLEDNTDDFDPLLPILPMPPQLQMNTANVEPLTTGDGQSSSLLKLLLDRIGDKDIPPPDAPQPALTVALPHLHNYDFSPVVHGNDGPNTAEGLTVEGGSDSLPLAGQVAPTHSSQCYVTSPTLPQCAQGGKHMQHSKISNSAIDSGSIEEHTSCGKRQCFQFKRAEEANNIGTVATVGSRRVVQK
ncbi:uncharacterized protein HD556DRAFT_1438904 [Suillus plorans]|uniref:Uncharacterized protein n=1 Tax=Suillus plorans TaxID=116603 RepID=A0A9P7J3E8_9AGAM|nr:uncharacterized protein HD556DRAFT_1438904 [Suillus plorans]KAG1800905.1 hypothetical protein HD556DRAFT_1438904 [Suillus plorans]